MLSSAKFIIPAKTMFLLASLLFAHEGFSIAFRTDGSVPTKAQHVPAGSDSQAVSVDLEYGFVPEAAGAGGDGTVVSGATKPTRNILQRFRNKVENLLPSKKNMLQSAAFLPKISIALIIAMLVLHLHLASEYAVATNTTNAAGVVGEENWRKFSDLSFDERTYMDYYLVKSDSIESTSGSWVSTEHSEHNNSSQVWVRYSKYCKNNADYCAAIGDWFRPLTATLMHNDYGHLRNNIFGLFMFGLVVENRQSFAAVLLIVWVSAFCCKGIDIYRDDFHSQRRSAGASGVVYGLITRCQANRGQKNLY